jgi:hypothetical protein
MIKLVSFQGCKDGPTQANQNVLQHKKRIKDIKKTHDHLNKCKKAFDKIQKLYDKCIEEARSRRNVSQHNEDYILYPNHT